MRKLTTPLSALPVLVLWLIAAGLGLAQQTTVPGASPPLISAPGMTPVPTAPGPTSSLQQPTFDPYGTGAGAASAPPSLLPSPPASTFGATTPSYTQPYGSGAAAPAPYSGQPYAGQTYAGQPSVVPPYTGQPAAGQPYTGQPYYGQPYPGQPYYGQPYPGTPAPGFGTTAPPVLFPGLFGPAQPGATTSSTGGGLKLLQHLRLSYDFLPGDAGTDLQINDAFLTTTIALPNFLWTGQPWFISPGFGLHLWSGPWDGNIFHDLPPRAYSAFLDLGWQSNPASQFGVELGGRLGVFSDFEAWESEALRPSGIALARYNLTPTLALKAGVSYINRADLKLLPAFGLLWTPNPQTRWDIFFPQPKLSSYLTTLGTQELWWYIGGEYGGGTWLVQTGSAWAASNQLMDINDIRVFLGLQLKQPVAGGVGDRGMFIELGYVFEREMVYVATPDQSYSLGDTLMVRGGIAF